MVLLCPISPHCMGLSYGNATQLQMNGNISSTQKNSQEHGITKEENQDRVLGSMTKSCLAYT